VQESLGILLLLRPEPGIDFGDVDRATGQGVALLDQIRKKLPAAFLVVDGVDDDAGIEEISGHGLAGGYFFKALVVFTTQLADVFGGALLQFRVVLFVPGHQLIKGLELTPPHEFLLGRLGDKNAALPTAHQGVNVLDQLIREDNMCSSVHGCC
jgi:hypothetical protein